MQNDVTPDWMLAQWFNHSFVRRFYKHVVKEADCWRWNGWLDRHGYGQIRANNTRALAGVKAHRASWMIANGRLVPCEALVLHKCPGGGNPWCVNPNHLALGTVQENVDDMIRNGRMNQSNKAKGEAAGLSKLTEAQVILIKQKINLGLKRGELTAIANSVGVCPETIYAIASGKTWKHVLVS